MLCKEFKIETVGKLETSEMDLEYLFPLLEVR